MKLIGNFLDRIPKGLVDEIMANDGQITPVYQPDKWKGHPMYDKARIELEQAGFHKGGHKFHQFTVETECMKKFLPEIQEKTNNFRFDESVIPGNYDFYHWWIVKYLPGDMQPMHFDPHIVNTKECKRYTMMLTDFEDGHIFVYDDFLLTDYKAGDLFLWPDAMIIHGAANISMNTRLSLQLSFYNK